MLYSELSKKPLEEFKRYCGVQKDTFLEMVRIVTKAKRGSVGVRSKLSIPDQILLTLDYHREYRTLFHIAGDFGISESACCRTVKRIENMLMASGEFSLPSQRKLQQNNSEIKTVAVDVVEIEIERPKKNRKAVIVASKSTIR
jgi:hypothetical protein